MAQVAAVYDATPAPRTGADIIALPAEGGRERPGGEDLGQVVDREREKRTPRE
jgi:hypothetical protein